jgi:SynChlorMet cassette radical SAM/SPASM protein ScmE
MAITMKIFSAPEKVTLNTTNRCNLKCLYCGVSSTKNAPGDLTLGEWKTLVDELAQIKVFNLLISGGEPFIRTDFYALLQHILQYPFRVSINTNATLIDEKVVSLLSGNRRLENIQISLDGADSGTHDYIRGQGSFKKILKGTGLLQKYHIPFSFYVVVCRNNRDHIKEIVDLAQKVRASQITFSTLLPQGSAIKNFQALSLTFSEQKNVEAQLRQLKKSYPRLIGGSLIQTIQWMDKVSQLPDAEKSEKQVNTISSCGGGVSECAVRPEGWVIPCDRMWDYKVGNIKEASFTSIWQEAEGFLNLRRRYSRRMDSFEECKNCTYIDVCKGGCPAIPYNLGKGFDGWDPLSCYKVFNGQKKMTLLEPC